MLYKIKFYAHTDFEKLEETLIVTTYTQQQPISFFGISHKQAPQTNIIC